MLATTLAAIGVSAGMGLFLTDLPPALAAVFAPLAVAWGARLASCEWRRPAEALVLRADGRVEVANGPVDGFRIGWQGPLTWMEWCIEGRRERRVAWPDVIDAALRRELRLWTLGRGVRASTAAVAP